MKDFARRSHEDESILLSSVTLKSFQMKCIPQENPKLEVPRAFLDAAIEGFRDHVHNSCAELVFNLNEIGIGDWEDRTERRVIVPLTTRGRRFFTVSTGT
jgi:hypothetical protein